MANIANDWIPESQAIGTKIPNDWVSEEQGVALAKSPSNQGAPEDKGATKGPSEPKQEEGGDSSGLPPIMLDKTAAIKNRAFEISTNLFQREIEAIIDEVDTELRMGGVLVRDIKNKYEIKADKLITKWIKESALPRPEKKKLEAQYRQDFIDIINERIKLIG